MDYLEKLFRTDESSGPLVLRLMLGLVIFPHGAQKLLGWFGGHGFEGTLGFFTQTVGVPMVIAFLIIMGEFFGSLGLMAGFLTRFSAVGVLCIMLGAVSMVHWPNGFFMNWSGKAPGEGFEYHLLAIGMAVALIISGGGKFSLDRWVSQTFLQKRED